MITKAMLARCQNELRQAFCALDKDVQEAIFNNREYQEHYCMCSGKPEWTPGVLFTMHSTSVLRLSPDTPTEPDWEEREVILSGDGFYAVAGLFNLVGQRVTVVVATCHRNFIGVWYTLNGTETLHTSVDAAFGSPVRVRFRK